MKVVELRKYAYSVASPGKPPRLVVGVAETEAEAYAKVDKDPQTLEHGAEVRLAAAAAGARLVVVGRQGTMKIIMGDGDPYMPDIMQSKWKDTSDDE